ncbi:unnamed protein product [Albugo candida]|uniref:Uncharacterized protein n=1 Tax=Albugo candida TaxID=65357 RepID=A0A024GDG8_9STRA|nr:unnamed protein product [Albugo candida]|eukprot:CCI44813.1 unnamed protein product [Albugo candida]
MENEDSSFGFILVLALVVLSTLYFIFLQNNGEQRMTQQRHETSGSNAQSKSDNVTRASVNALSEFQLRLHRALPSRNGSRTMTISGEALFSSLTDVEAHQSNSLKWKDEKLPILLHDLIQIANVFILCTISAGCDKKVMERVRFAVVSSVRNTVSDSETQSHQFPAHKILFCSTSIGKIAFVRQLEPQIHVEVDMQVVRDLQAHVPRILYTSSCIEALPPFASIVHVAEGLMPYCDLIRTSAQ